MEEKFQKTRENWARANGLIYHENPDYIQRIGDEIQLTAVLKYFKSLGHQILYKDACPHISALTIFPDHLVTFVHDNFANAPKIDPFNIWIWSPLISSMGFYTETQYKYDANKITYDVVFIPCLNPEYNEVRGLLPSNAYEILISLKRNFKNVKMIIDKNKKHLMEKYKDDSIVYSDNIHTTFKYIEKSKFFVGCDTGTSHYAGSINHPRMIMIYPDESEVQERIWWQNEAMSWIFNEPRFLQFKATTFPCCNPKNYRKIQISNNAVRPEDVITQISKFN
jgi:hypothetical protein